MHSYTSLCLYAGVENNKNGSVAKLMICSSVLTVSEVLIQIYGEFEAVLGGEVLLCILTELVKQNTIKVFLQEHV